MIKQTTNIILMIEPVAFGYNAQTATNNHFQQSQPADEANWIQYQALVEFNRMTTALTQKGIKVITIKDTTLPHTPDSIFPNNWISFHHDGRVVLYPMYAENRREERRKEILDQLSSTDFDIKETINYTFYEELNMFLEGTGSMVLDRINKIAYAAISERTHAFVLKQFCNDFQYTGSTFHAYHTVNGNRLPVYHTNVMMCIGNTYAVVCLSAIDNIDERNTLISNLNNTGKEIIEITEQQMGCFAGNMLQVENDADISFLVMSQSAYDSLSPMQLRRLESYNQLIPVAIPTIEKYGGGSARCMIAEIMSPLKISLN